MMAASHNSQVVADDGSGRKNNLDIADVDPNDPESIRGFLDAIGHSVCSSSQSESEVGGEDEGDFENAGVHSETTPPVGDEEDAMIPSESSSQSESEVGGEDEGEFENTGVHIIVEQETEGQQRKLSQRELVELWCEGWVVVGQEVSLQARRWWRVKPRASQRGLDRGDHDGGVRDLPALLRLMQDGSADPRSLEVFNRCAQPCYYPEAARFFEIATNGVEFANPFTRAGGAVEAWMSEADDAEDDDGEDPFTRTPFDYDFDFDAGVGEDPSTSLPYEFCADDMEPVYGDELHRGDPGVIEMIRGLTVTRGHEAPPNSLAGEKSQLEMEMASLDELLKDLDSEDRPLLAIEEIEMQLDDLLFQAAVRELLGFDVEGLVAYLAADEFTFVDHDDAFDQPYCDLRPHEPELECWCYWCRLYFRPGLDNPLAEVHDPSVWCPCDDCAVFWLRHRIRSLAAMVNAEEARLIEVAQRLQDIQMQEEPRRLEMRFCGSSYDSSHYSSGSSIHSSLTRNGMANCTIPFRFFQPRADDRLLAEADNRLLDDLNLLFPEGADNRFLDEADYFSSPYPQAADTEREAGAPDDAGESWEQGRRRDLEDELGVWQQEENERFQEVMGYELRRARGVERVPGGGGMIGRRRRKGICERIFDWVRRWFSGGEGA